MSSTSQMSTRLRDVIYSEIDHVQALLAHYGATNPRIFGSVARGDATSQSDLDILVDLASGHGNELLRVSGLAEELTDLLGVRVEVVAASLLRDEVSTTAVGDSIAL